MAFANKPAYALCALLTWASACGDADDAAETGAFGGRGQGGTAGQSAGRNSLGGEVSAGGRAFGGSAGAVASAGADAGVGGTAPGSGGSLGPGAGAGGHFAGAAGEATGASGGVPVFVDPVLCARLDGTQVLAARVTGGYVQTLFADCRVSGFVQAAATNLLSGMNRLRDFNLELWGCGADEPTDFPLTFGATVLTRAEADLLITLYLDQTTIYLQLGDRERARLNTKLQAIAATHVTSPSEDLAHSQCVVGSGGSGGAAGEAGAATSGATSSGSGGAGGGGTP